MLTFCGFNGFKQFGAEHELKVATFKNYAVDDAFVSDENTLIAASWNYIALANGHSLLLRGFLASKPNATWKLTAEHSVKQLATCSSFCLVLLETGKLLKLLPALDARLQEVRLDTTEAAVLPQKRTIFGKPKAEAVFEITHIACGMNIAVAISNNNGVYSIPSKVHQFPSHLRTQKLACGFEHALLLSSNGDVYSWGNGLRGQLGHDELRIAEAPCLIDALAGIKITFIAAGGWHSAAISAFGDLYIWGFNSNGQLGLKLYKTIECKLQKQPSVYPLPQLIDFPKSNETEEDDLENACEPLKVFAGARHTVVQMNDGSIFVAGWNAHGQLGLADDQESCDTFKKLDKVVTNFNKFKIVCGEWNTILICCKNDR